MVISKDAPIISPPYTGRFAPSPTGPLHAGSLLSAVGSYLEARARGGRWLVRMEDLDPPREMPGAADDILRTLAGFGFEWDGEVMYQSRRLERYREVLAGLQRDGQSYACACTRREIADSSVRGIDGPVYPGTCRAGLPAGKTGRAWRIKLADNVTVTFTDALQGLQRQNLARDLGDFVLLRADGYFAYQLAVVVDDADQAISHIVRGADLLDSAPRQIYLQQVLGYPQPQYAHLPVLINSAGEKLSKQTRAAPLDMSRRSLLLCQTLDKLGQMPPGALFSASLTDIWSWAFTNWRLDKVPTCRDLVEPLCGSDEPV
ncbi:tRNA glutamyl-Q(34) synthetase GluQRS [Chitinimonas viridis]|uniref:Glutamyl-Q tRNA(Asp) synthetase n=1 Tax=Chitinimonas viridis TaxID=664880 RepID=A0ABT8B4V8_9NEIS|nr:tRNA glutamyl-Q(34) synthetase GluQRS [Chitinimonas viridis]MDN3577298.1 tRNA glutamyl-Q(34) synthetase GluQRS [Chitinimonas viridis]